MSLGVFVRRHVMGSQLAIDIGTCNTIVYVSGRGVIVEEPSVILVDRLTRRTISAGQAAFDLLGREPAGLEAISPVREGAVADWDACKSLVSFLLQRSGRHLHLPHATAIACVSSGATEVERRALSAAVEAGAHRRVALLDQPWAAALGAGLAGTERDSGGGVVDIGGGTTEIGLVAAGSVVRERALRLGGNAMDYAVLHEVKSHLGLTIGERTAERLKRTVGLEGTSTDMVEVAGVDPRGLGLRVEHIATERVSSALEPAVTAVIEAVRDVLADMPADLAEVIEKGTVWLSGGVSQMKGLAARLEKEIGLRTKLAPDPMRCVVRGATQLLEDGSARRRLRAA
ncbi:MAG: rod shape-determining protein [Actinobacteria bacterium]|nr:rod shape-determining protein [Actinomycetota bacterium]